MNQNNHRIQFGFLIVTSVIVVGLLLHAHSLVSLSRITEISLGSAEPFTIQFETEGNQIPQEMGKFVFETKTYTIALLLPSVELPDLWNVEVRITDGTNFDQSVRTSSSMYSITTVNDEMLIELGHVTFDAGKEYRVILEECNGISTNDLRVGFAEGVVDSGLGVLGNILLMLFSGLIIVVGLIFFVTVVVYYALKVSGSANLHVSKPFTLAVGGIGLVLLVLSVLAPIILTAGITTQEAGNNDPGLIFSSWTSWSLATAITGVLSLACAGLFALNRRQEHPPESYHPPTYHSTRPPINSASNVPNSAIGDQGEQLLQQPDNESSPAPKFNFCPDCGENVPSDARFCGNCGRSFQ